MHILIHYPYDNDSWNRLAAYLKRHKYRVTVVTKHTEVHRLLKSEDVHILLSAYDIPKVNTLTFLKKAKDAKPQIEAIFLGDRIPLTKAIEAMNNGAYDIYEFPVNYRLLLAVIDKAIEKQTLFMEKTELERQVRQKFNFENIIGRSKKIQDVTEMIGSVAPKNVNILLTGETGTGKEKIADAIHYNSPRAAKPFIKVNCAAFNEGVLESELFGHEKGAFTGALTRRVGRFELADGGTIFLDEIGDLPMGIQIKLLRVIQERKFERVGGNETLTVDVRVIAATNQNLRDLIKEKKFREDLYYRLNVVHIEIPSLQDRKEDIPLLISHFIHKLNEEKDYGIKGITKEAVHILTNYPWPGNVRELENAIESSMAIAERDMIEAKYLPSFLLMNSSVDAGLYQFPCTMTLEEIEKEVIRLALEKTGGNKSMASRLLGISLRTLQRKAS